VFALLVAAGVFAGAAWLGFGRSSADRRAFAVRQSELDAIVAAVSREPMAVGETTLFTFSSGRLTRGGVTGNNLGGQIAARKTADGRLFVMVVTADHHHAGIFGFLYASAPPQPHELGPDSWSGEQTSFKVPGDREWWVREAMTPQWWSVENRLD
jgi:hypothetical protein